MTKKEQRFAKWLEKREKKEQRAVLYEKLRQPELQFPSANLLSSKTLVRKRKAAEMREEDGNGRTGVSIAAPDAGTDSDDGSSDGSQPTRRKRRPHVVPFSKPPRLIFLGSALKQAVPVTAVKVDEEGNRVMTGAVNEDDESDDESVAASASGEVAEPIDAGTVPSPAGPSTSADAAAEGGAAAPVTVDGRGSMSRRTPEPAPFTLAEKAEMKPFALSTEFVSVTRTPDIQAARMLLPVCQEEGHILETVLANDIVIISGETGSGKTTQIPQFLYEMGYARRGLIGITQPRRIAAIATAERIAVELGDSSVVAYQIRHDHTLSASTRIKLMTDGILLRELSSDFLLSKYSVVVVDEAHERSLNTDILLGLLSRIVRLRREEGNPLRLVIMSATLRLKDFLENRRLFPQTPPPLISIRARQHPVTVHFNRITPHQDYIAEALHKIGQIDRGLPPGGILVFLTGKAEINDLAGKLRDAAEEHGAECSLHVLPLHSMLSKERQMQVFAPVPEGKRLCVLATNVAETSITIPDIKYVVDTGKVKSRFFDAHDSTHNFEVHWISKAAAEQRSGRAGRTGPGHCYRLYSSAVFDAQFADFDKPEIETIAVESVVLQMRAMNIDNILNFPFPSPLPRSSLRTAERALTYLGALDVQTNAVTAMGRSMAQLPLSPRFAKMVILGKANDLPLHAAALSAALTVADPMLDAADQDAAGKRSTSVAMHNANGDAFRLLSLLGAYMFESEPQKREEFCARAKVRAKAMSEMSQMFAQICALMEVAPEPVRPPTAAEVRALQQILLAGFVDQVAVRNDRAHKDNAVLVPYRTAKTDDAVYIHPSSCLFGKAPPKYVVYAELVKTTRPYMKTVSAVDKDCLDEHAARLPPLKGFLDALK